MPQEVKKSFYTTVDHPFEISNTEEVDCNFCGSSAFTSIGTELDYDIRQCTECKLVYINPQPTADEIPGFYDNMYLYMEFLRSIGLCLGQDIRNCVVFNLICLKRIRALLHNDCIRMLNLMQDSRPQNLHIHIHVP